MDQKDLLTNLLTIIKTLLKTTLLFTLLTFLSVKAFSQTTHTYSLSTSDFSVTETDNIQLDDSIKFINSLGYIADINYSIDGGGWASVTVVNGGVIYNQKVVTTNSFSITVSEGLYSKTINFIVSESTAGLAEKSLKYNVYPNPTTDFLNIDGVQVISVKVFDMSGKLMINENSTKLDVSYLKFQNTNLNLITWMPIPLKKNGANS